MNPSNRMDDEFRDSEISSLLGRVGGDAPATHAAYQQVLGRVRHVRRRRTVLTALGASTLVIAIGAVVIRGSSSNTDRFALDPRAAVVTTPDGAVVTTPDGAVVTVITQPEDTTTVPVDQTTVDVPTSDATSDPSVSTPTTVLAPSGPSTSQPFSNTTPSGTNRPTGSTDQTTTTVPAPTTSKPAIPTIPSTTKPAPAPTTTKPAIPTIPSTTKPAPAPTTTKPSVPVVSPPSVPVVDNSITRVCGAGAIRIDVVDDSFVPGSLQSLALPGIRTTVESVKAKSVEVTFANASGKRVATLKVRITGQTIKTSCDLDVEDDSAEDGQGTIPSEARSVSSPASSATGDNGDRADD